MLLNSLLLICLMLLGWYAFRYGELSRWYLPALLLRLLGGLVLGYVYLQQGGGDTWVFHRQAVEMARLPASEYVSELQLLIKPFESFQGAERHLFFIRFISIFYTLGANYWLASCWLSFLSFLGCFFLADRLVKRWPKLYWPALLAWLFWPSIIFWGSGLLKDGLVLACIAFSVGLVLYVPGLKKPKTLWLLLLLVPAGWIIWQLKYYVAILFFGFLLVYVLLSFLQNRYKLSLLSLLLWGALFGGAAFLLLSQLHPNLWLNRLPEVMVQQYEQSAAASEAGSFKAYPALEPNWFNLLLHMPPAALVGLFAPLKFPLAKPWVIIAGLENLLLLGLSLWSLLVIWSGKGKRPITMAAAICLLYVLALAASFGITSPNYGSLVRYKIACLPFFVMLVLIWPQYWLKLVSRAGAIRRARLGKRPFSRTFAAQK